MTAEICDHCNRPILYPVGSASHNGHGPIAAVYVVHNGYGCDTGCCGHSVIAVDERDSVIHESFEFAHPYSEDYETFAKELAHEYFPHAPFDWERCEVSDD